MALAHNSLTDKEYNSLAISIGKAFSSFEAPIKSKHVRAIIIGTYHSNGGHAFWTITIRQPLQENRITAWKFCHVLHKLLRDGHPLVIQHSMRQRSMITDMGKLWGHLNDGYGFCIKQYTKLLVSKLNFHDRNPRFPGSLVLKRGELDRENDINLYFQLAVEMFDYLDDLVALQATIFNSITTFAVSSMTPAGQCRLAPLIPCIQDSNQLYDFVVRLMFLLHANLPDDLLNGHRERFKTLFRQLNSFYKQAGQLQYFVNLIKVPSLPSSPPNFLLQSELGNYHPPVVVVPQESLEPDNNSVVENLVDTSTFKPEFVPKPQTPPLPSIDFDALLKERDEVIRRQQAEIAEIDQQRRQIIKNTLDEKRELEAKIQEHVAVLNSELTEARNALSNIRIEKEELILKAQTSPERELKALAVEERAKASEEKFQKLRNMYTQIRDEHIKLLRQHGDVSKQLAENTKVLNDAINEKEKVNDKLLEIQVEQKKVEATLQQYSSEGDRERSILTEKICMLETQKAFHMEQFHDSEAIKSQEIAELNINVASLQKIINELRENSTKLNNENLRIEEEYKKVLDSKSDVENSYQKALLSVDKLQVSENEKKKLEEQYCAQKVENKYLTQQIENKFREYENLEITFNEQSTRNISLEKEIEISEKKFQIMNGNYDRLLIEKNNFETDIQDLLHQQEQLNEEKSAILMAQDKLEISLLDSKIQGETALRTLLEACIKSSENIVVRAIESEVPGASGTTTSFISLAEELQDCLSKLKIVHDNYLNDSNRNVEAFVRKVVTTSHLLALVMEQGMRMCNKSTNIDTGEKTATELKIFGQHASQLYETLHNTTASGLINPQVEELKDRLYKITNKVCNLKTKNDEIDQLGDLVEKELSGMDLAIEEAAQKIVDMLTQTKASDSGIKLEVNEKILDACTSLMKSIQILVQKSRKVQAEIVAMGKGTASAKEFYKRNHQWTEGLISAAKSVANGAKFLVEAANKSVSGESKHTLDIVVAAQEIAASSCQLVVASRVKAPKSNQLQELTQASRNVSVSTGIVVAIAKDCSQRLEDGQDFDFSKLSLHQAKTKEMEIQVKVLELEQALNNERMKLASMRKQNYQAME